MDKLSVVRSIWMAATRERVWQAITNPDHVVQWFAPNLPGARMTRDENGKVTVHLGEMGVDFVVLEMIDPLRRASYQSLPEGLITTTYSLEEEKAGTRVTVTMTGFELLPADAREDRLEQSGAGWEQALNNLKAHVDGTPLPHPQAFVGPLFGYWRVAQKTVGIERSIWIGGSRQRVWEAIADPKQLQQWFSPTTPWHLSALEVGGRYYAVNEETQAEMYVGVIEVLDPPNQLVLRNEPDAPGGRVARTSYTLTEENGGTRLTLTYTGYENEADDARWGHMEENTFGFGMMLQNTKAFVEGNTLPFPWGF